MPEKSSFRLAYRPALDGLRGLAVLMVMAHHASLAAGGFLGVDVFFVLSGFLITGLLIQEWERSGSVSLKNFYARRALRLLPALVTLLSTVVVVPRLFGIGNAAPWREALAVLFYAANWVSAFQLLNLGILSHTWSLAIEEQFYFLWPPLLTLLLVLKVPRRWILGLVLLGIASAGLIRVTLWQSFGPDSWTRLYYGLDTRMDSVLLGCLIGLLAAWDKLPRRGWAPAKYAFALAALILVVLTYAAPTPESGSLYHGVEFLACGAATVVLVGLLTSAPRLAFTILEQTTLVWVGRISYGLYLWHVPVFQGFLNGTRMARWGIEGEWLQLLRFAITFAVAGASYYLIELPMLRLKKRFRGGGGPSPVRPSADGA